MPKRRTKSKYSPHPGLSQEAADKQKVLEATGRSFDGWIAHARRKGPKKQTELRQWLREQGHGSRNAWWIASVASGAWDQPDYDDPESLVGALYSGDKAAWRPVHEKVVDAALACGSDVIATSCKTMVPIYRKHVFAELRPVADGVEVQLALGEKPKDVRFESISRRNPGDRLTHRAVFSRESDVDARFADALRTAYELGAGKIARRSDVKTPPDLAKALKASEKATATWDTCTDAMRRDWILWIESAKQDETRTRRIGQAIGRLAAGRKKMY
jgi:hypothetical protein